MILYSLGIKIYRFFISLAALFNPKARAWVEGSKLHSVPEDFRTKTPEKRRIWFHISSLGEYEQAKPVLAILSQSHELVITFFSPSGYEKCKVNPFTDQVFYLGIDSKSNAKRNIQRINADLFVLVKYDFWLNHLNILNKIGTPVLLLSGLFRREQIFFKWYGGIFKNALRNMTQIFLQNEASKTLLTQIGIDQTQVTGDTRIDSVEKNIVDAALLVPSGIQDYVGSDPCLILGSAYEEETNWLSLALKNHHLKNWKVIIAPHDVSLSNVSKITSALDHPFQLYSEQQDTLDKEKILVVDSVGLLKQLYSLADFAVIGGGFHKTVHNTLEPAAYSLPLIFGPNYKKFVETVQLVDSESAFSVTNSEEFLEKLQFLLSKTNRKMAGMKARQFIESNLGASEKFSSYILENEL